MSFTSYNSYLLHVWHVRSYSKQTYTSTMENRNISKSYQIHTVSNYIDTPFNSFSYRFIKFSFSKGSRPESPTRPGWRIQAGARFTLTFSIIFSKHFVWFYEIFVFKSVATQIPDSTRLANPSQSPTYFDIFNYLLKTYCLCYSILDFLIMRKHFIMGKPINIYN